MECDNKYKGVSEIYIEDVFGIDTPVIIKSYSVSDSNSKGWEQYMSRVLLDFKHPTGKVFKDHLIFVSQKSNLFGHHPSDIRSLTNFKSDIEESIQMIKEISECYVYPKPSKGIRLNLLKGKIRSYFSLNRIWICFNDIGYEIRRLSKYRSKDFEGMNGSCYKDLFGFRIVKRKFFNSKYSKEYWYE